MSVISMKDLLESGVHFGHQTRRWDPKMAPFIYTTRNGIHIIDLQKTVEKGEIAYSFIRDILKESGKILFIGTKKQAQEAMKKEAIRCNQFYVTHRWLGGMLTNFETIKKSIYRLKKLEKMEVDGTFEALTKKEVLNLTREKDKLEKVLGGIKEMNTLPNAVFIIDPKKEYIAVNEARKLNIPVVAIVDTNCDPTIIDYPVPGNDDAIRAINLFASIIADAAIEGETLLGKEMADNIATQMPETKETEEIKTKSTVETKQEVTNEKMAFTKSASTKDEVTNKETASTKSTSTKDEVTNEETASTKSTSTKDEVTNEETASTKTSSTKDEVTNEETASTKTSSTKDEVTNEETASTKSTSTKNEVTNGETASTKSTSTNKSESKESVDLSDKEMNTTEIVEEKQSTTENVSSD